MFRQRVMFQHPDIRLEMRGGALAVSTPYAPALVNELKARVPAADRKWDATNKVWLVTPAHGPFVQQIVQRFFGVAVDLPDGCDTTGSQPRRVQLLDVRYIGLTKVREDGSESAFGWADGGWNVMLPKNVLMEWFGQEVRPGQAMTLYAVLGLKQTATAQEMKAAHRRLAKQWHPDTCREPDAVEQFRKIQEAWEVLGNWRLRQKYDVGLALAAMVNAVSQDSYMSPAQGYRSPLRCGWILAEGVDALGRFSVERILQWADIVDAGGSTLVVSWPAGADKFTETWVTA